MSAGSSDTEFLSADQTAAGGNVVENINIIF